MVKGGILEKIIPEGIIPKEFATKETPDATL